VHARPTNGKVGSRRKSDAYELRKKIMKPPHRSKKKRKTREKAQFPSSEAEKKREKRFGVWTKKKKVRSLGGPGGRSRRENEKFPE